MKKKPVDRQTEASLITQWSENALKILADSKTNRTSVDMSLETILHKFLMNWKLREFIVAHRWCFIAPLR